MCENTIYGWLDKTKDLMLAFVFGLLPMLPGPLKAGLDFIGISDYLEKSLNKVHEFEEKKREREYKEYAR